MIAFVRGRVAALTLNAAIIDIGGVGYHVFCTPGTIAGLRLGTEAELSTSLVVREDSQTLYGFADTDERDMFELVQTASGVGPKVAQAMVAVLPPDRLRTAIANGDHAALTSVPGIGRKGAERIILELKDRVGPPVTVSSPGRWSTRDADAAVEAVAADAEAGADVATLLRAALRTLART
jgi:Holliday junction DNA helicase RuvA